MVKVYELYDQGTASIPEDTKFNYLSSTYGAIGYVGVADGVSGLYIPSEGPMKFGKRSGGQLATAVLQKTFSQAPLPGLESIDQVVMRASVELADILKICIPELTKDSYATLVAGLPGATFAVAKLDARRLEITQCGDCLALWEMRDGTIGATKNQVYLHDTQARQTIAQLMEKHGGDRGKMWAEFTPILAQWRVDHINTRTTLMSYGLFNGQQELLDLIRPFVLPRREIRTLILATDGLFFYPETGDEKSLAEKAFDLFKQGGLEAILADTRRLEETERASSHIDHAEATAIAIEF